MPAPTNTHTHTSQSVESKHYTLPKNEKKERKVYMHEEKEMTPTERELVRERG